MDTISILPASDAFLDTAANELQTYLEKMSGKVWKIVKGNPGYSAIRLDVNPDLPDFTSRSDEAVKIISDAAGIRITGKTSAATRHGAYILLEKLGVRWFFKHPAWEVVPESLEDPGTLNEIQDPSFFYRLIVPAGNYNHTASNNWNLRNRMPGTSLYPGRHTYSSIIDISEYPKHPDWFIGSPPGGTWQLNPENPEVIARAIQYARDQLSQPPVKTPYSIDPLGLGAACISPRDGGGFNPPYDQTNVQLITDRVFYLANEVAKAIKTEFPGKYVSLLNYFIYSGVPTYDLEPNLLAFVTTGYSYSNLLLTQRIEGLRSRGAEVGIYDYLDVWVYEQDSPDINFDHVRQISTYASSGAKAYKVEASDSWAGNGLTYYLISKLLWDSNADVEFLLDDFYTRAFGPAKQVMKHYFENRETDDAALAASFKNLDEAESLAAGNSEIIERIRYLEYYTRYLWLWHNKGITNLTLDELKKFYTFITKIKDLYVVTSNYVLNDLRKELENRGLTSSEIEALKDFTPPTAVESRRWLNEALAAFSGFFTPYINPREIELKTLGDAEPRLPVMHGWFQDILVPSEGNENIDILVKGKGVIQWYDPTGLLIDYESFENKLEDWTSVTFNATLPGTYILHSTYSRPVGSALYVDVPDRPASIIANPTRNIFQPAETPPMNAPSYWGSTAEYFYVPSGTVNFRFGASVVFSKWPAHGQLTDPNGITYPFNFDKQDWYSDEIAFVSPVPGIWKVEIDMNSRSGQFWLVGIPPLVWHDSKYLLVPAADSSPPLPVPPTPPSSGGSGGGGGGVPLNSKPVADDQIVGTDENTPVSFTLTASDPNGDTLTYAIVSSPFKGTLSDTPPVLTYTPDPAFTGSDNFTYITSDGQTTSNTATVSITVNSVNKPPIAINQSAVTDLNKPVDIVLGASDADGDTLVYNLVTMPTHGTLSGPTLSLVTYTPDAAFTGSDNFTFTASDGKSTSNTANVSITVRQVNGLPVAFNHDLVTGSDTTLYIVVSASDPDDDALTYAIVNSPSFGILSGALPSVTYNPNPAFTGSDMFTFTASDGKSTSNTATVIITVNRSNRLPSANDQNVTITGNTPTDIILNAFDSDGDSLTYAITNGPSNGTLSGSLPFVTYIPNRDFQGSDSFTFTASDGEATSEPAVVTIIGNGENPAFVIPFIGLGKSGNLPVIFAVPPTILVVALAGVLSYRYARRSVKRYKRPKLTMLSFVQRVLDSRKFKD
ncbi:MAG: DUF4838 domain-containing protein [Dehalococcoidales bacterium]|nr:DUF4838 domain-containing protein [Dehalococcoidales bacterium]